MKQKASFDCNDDKFDTMKSAIDLVSCLLNGSLMATRVGSVTDCERSGVCSSKDVTKSQNG